MRLLKKLFEILRTPSGLAGGFFGAMVLAAVPKGVGVMGFVLGWLYGIVVGALLRLFRVAGWPRIFLGLLVGPMPLAFFLGAGASEGDRGIVFLGLLGGLWIGFVEWAVARGAAARELRLEDGS